MSGKCLLQLRIRKLKRRGADIALPCTVEAPGPPKPRHQTLSQLFGDSDLGISGHSVSQWVAIIPVPCSRATFKRCCDFILVNRGLLHPFVDFE
jgi:hypothetical protein